MNALPSAWPTRRARFLFREVIDRGHDLPLASVTRSGGVQFRSDLDISVWNPGEDTSTYKRVLPGDFVIGLRSFQSGLGFSPLEGLVSPAYTVLRPASPEVIGRYFKHLFKSSVFVTLLDNVSQGIRQGRTISTEDFYDLHLPIPTRETQMAIANYLDAETSRIDSLIAKKRRTIELLAERWLVVLERSLAGLSPVSSIRETGVSWCPALNEGYDLVPLKRALRFLEGPGILEEDFRETGAPLLRVSCLRAGTISLVGCNYLDKDQAARRWGKFRVQEGDHLISTSASMGLVSRVGAEAAGAYLYTGLIKVWSGELNMDMGFARFFLGSSLFLRQIDVMKTGTAIQHYGPSHLARMGIPLPPREEQVRVAEHLEQERAQIDEATRKLRHQIDLLVEHKQALITAVVTGEVDIPGAAA